jgi:hypothetical protein
MDKELLMIAAMSISGCLFAIGGTGFKWARRYLLPVCLGILAIIGGNPWHYALAMTLCLIGSLSLHYGERTNFALKTIVFMAIFGSTAWLGFSYWQIIGVVTALILFKLSNIKWTQNIVFWKAWEFITGSLIGITVASLMWR